MLVIVMCSCSGIMTRSFVHRRRHRRLFEAVRNGWIPPADDREFGAGRGSHGVSKEPKMWEMFIQAQDVAGSGHGDAEWDWDSMKPLSATTTEKSSSQKISLYSMTRPNTTNISPLTSATRIHHYLGIATLPVSPFPGSNAPAKSAPKPRNIAVATLIAMPSQARSSRVFSQLNQPAPSSPPLSMNSSSLSPPQPSVIPTTPPILRSILPSPSSLPRQQATSKLPSESKQALPYVEFGIVELVLQDEGHKEGSYHAG